ncbi:hypothetical protein [Xanthomonas maliensis]|uniref:hypothetical protein n=1 Tax=Xanthomonas maliensis TaxID=1321368 RepID=UPI0003AB19EC|nr:hypothetical protein [Xanthomonas maliensis]KAB7769160.1 hypothetical protein CKY51_07930 [Xanthomonas maliensis]
MKKTATLLLACTALGVTVQASAQSLSRGWDSYRQQQKQQQQSGGQVAPAALPATNGTATTAPQGDAGGADRFVTVTAQTPAVAAPPAAATRIASSEESRIERGAFIGVQSGRGEVFRGYKQDMLGLSAGYRWQAGSVTLIGVEASLGRLDRKDNHDDVFIPGVKFVAVGGTARFNFGDSPLFAVVRLGSWYADAADLSEEVYGGYAGVGLGLDLGKHASLSVTYTNYLYARDYYDYAEDVTINRAEVLNVGAEVRF